MIQMLPISTVLLKVASRATSSDPFRGVLPPFDAPVVAEGEDSRAENAVQRRARDRLFQMKAKSSADRLALV
jgi:hypothetical protein